MYEKNELTKNIFRSTLQFPSGFISHLPHPRGVVGPFTLRCSCQNCIINDTDCGTDISYKNPPIGFSSKSYSYRNTSTHRRMSRIPAVWARYDCIVLMETRFEVFMIPYLSYRFRFSATPDFYILFYHNLLNAVKSLLKSTYNERTIRRW